jgi:hypothetical protein
VMAWRLARSLQVLGDEVRKLRPGTTVWDIGDEAHQLSASDHNPNAADVVCATDTLGNAGLDLGWYAEQVRQAGLSGHPAPKYVIYNRRIASRSQGWTWRSYFGSNPHTGHVHVSVGSGPDGQSTGPYDDTSPWGLLPEQEEDDMTKEEFLDHLNFAFPRMMVSLTSDIDEPENGTRYWAGNLMGQDKMSGRQALMWGLGIAVDKLVMPELAAVKGQLAGLTALVQQLATMPAVPLTDDQLADLTAAVTQAAAGAAEQALERTRFVVDQG